MNVIKWKCNQKNQNFKKLLLKITFNRKIIFKLIAFSIEIKYNWLSFDMSTNKGERIFKCNHLHCCQEQIS